MRLRRFTAALLLLAVLSATTVRAELDASEKKWLKQCLDALTSKSGKVRDGGAAAISKLGFDAIPVLLPEVGRLKTDDDWSALTAALAPMGAKAAADLVDMARDKWPKGQEQRLGALVARLREPAAPVKGAAAGKASPDVEAKVRELLDPFRTANMYSSSDPAVEKVVAIGPAAIPALVEILREGDGGHGPGMLYTAATDALAELVNENDVPVLAQLLAEGRLVAARAFAKLRSPAALDALLGPVARGFVSFDVVRALENFSSNPRVGAALVSWISAHGAAGSWEVGPVAEFLGDHHVAAAVEPILKLTQVPLEAHAAQKVGGALAALGRKEGIETLIAVMEGKFAGVRPSDDYPRHEAGETLNRIVGRRIYSGSHEPGGGIRGNADEAATQFGAWWNGVKDKIRFDETRRAWVVD